MQKRVCAVGIEFAGDTIAHIPISSKQSLLDFDIALISPTIEYISRYDDTTYLGKPRLGEHNSFKIRKHIHHWRNEIREFLANNKFLICFLPSVQEFYIDTGERTHSGTGRNKSTTTIVEPVNNYNFLPFDLGGRSSNGEAMTLTKLGSEIIEPLWSQFGEKFEYKYVMDNNKYRSLITTKGGEKSVASILNVKDSNGRVVFLPNMDFYPDDFFGDDKDGASNNIWSDKANQFAPNFLSCILEIRRALDADIQLTPTPQWLDPSEFRFSKENAINQRLLRIESQIAELEQKKSNILGEQSEFDELRHLIYEKGSPLERAIISALKVVGFEAKQYQDSESEFDAVFYSREGRLIGEAEGRDSKPISIQKLRQLTMNIQEDFERDGVEKLAKGVLFGNGNRLAPDSERKEVFTKKCISGATMSRVTLIDTRHLFEIARYILNSKDKKFEREVRKLIISTEGILNIEVPDYK